MLMLNFVATLYFAEMLHFHFCSDVLFNGNVRICGDIHLYSDVPPFWRRCIFFLSFPVEVMFHSVMTFHVVMMSLIVVTLHFVVVFHC